MVLCKFKPHRAHDEVFYFWWFQIFVLYLQNNKILNMKKLLLCISLAALVSCEDDTQYKWSNRGKLTTLRIDDDSEYHFSTDRIVQNDIYNGSVQIVRKDTIPTLYVRMQKRSCDDHWSLAVVTSYKIVIPDNYKIETFED